MEILETTDNGESTVQITTLGKVVGSSLDGKPIEQNFSETALKTIADSQKDDILVDADHESERGDSTEAKGWLNSLEFIPGKGLFGKIKWTDIGRKLIENRVFRWLSPSWILNKDTLEPMTMTSVALTNKPSQLGSIEPIVNSQPIETKETLNMEITKEDLVNLIKETITSMKEPEQPDTVEEVKEDKVVDEEPVDKTEEPTEKDEEVKNEEPATVVETPKKKEEDVIKIESLNSAPTPTIASVEPWRSLHGQAFFDYVKQHKNEI